MGSRHIALDYKVRQSSFICIYSQFHRLLHSFGKTSKKSKILPPQKWCSGTFIAFLLPIFSKFLSFCPYIQVACPYNQVDLCSKIIGILDFCPYKEVALLKRCPYKEVPLYRQYWQCSRYTSLTAAWSETDVGQQSGEMKWTSTSTWSKHYTGKCI